MSLGMDQGKRTFIWHLCNGSGRETRSARSPWLGEAKEAFLGGDAVPAKHCTAPCRRVVARLSSRRYARYLVPGRTH